MDLLKQLLEAYLEANELEKKFTIEIINDMVRLIPVDHMFTQIDILLLTKFANENKFAYFVSTSYLDNELRWVIYEPKETHQ